MEGIRPMPLELDSLRNAVSALGEVVAKSEDDAFAQDARRLLDSLEASND